MHLARPFRLRGSSQPVQDREMGFDRRRDPILAGNGAQACRSFAIIKPPVERGGQCIGITVRNDGAMWRVAQ